MDPTVYMAFFDFGAHFPARKRTMTYEESLAYISNLEGRGWRLELDRIEHFVDLAGLRSYVSGEDRPYYFHVAGTNGKGSVTAFLQSMLVSAGYPTGAFFSPYVVDPRERIQIGRDLISESDFAQVATRIREIAVAMEDSEFGGVTEFEFKTVMGFEAWRRTNCRAVALEVGLGGRLDATNVVQPAVCGIVSIGLDHTSILGPTEDVIASEKAGIIKPGIPVVMGILSPPARESVHRRAAELNSQAWEVGVDIVIDGDHVTTPAGSVRGVQPSLGGKWQMHNAALAIGMLHAAGITSESLAEGISMAVAPGRFEVRQRAGNVVVLDGAHNGPAGASLVETLRQRFGDTRFTLITNMLVGHQIEDFYSVFDGIVDEVIVAPIFNSRARSTAEVREELGHLFPTARAANSVAEAFALAETGPILVTGSNYLVGDAIRFLDDET